MINADSSQPPMINAVFTVHRNRNKWEDFTFFACVHHIPINMKKKAIYSTTNMVHNIRIWKFIQFHKIWPIFHDRTLQGIEKRRVEGSRVLVQTFEIRRGNTNEILNVCVDDTMLYDFYFVRIVSKNV